MQLQTTLCHVLTLVMKLSDMAVPCQRLVMESGLLSMVLPLAKSSHPQLRLAALTLLGAAVEIVISVVQLRATALKALLDAGVLGDIAAELDLRGNDVAVLVPVLNLLKEVNVMGKCLVL